MLGENRNPNWMEQPEVEFSWKFWDAPNPIVGGFFQTPLKNMLVNMPNLLQFSGVERKNILVATTWVKVAFLSKRGDFFQNDDSFLPFWDVFFLTVRNQVLNGSFL